MVGDKYWAIGIVLDWHSNDSGEAWNARVEFFDSGFCEDKSTEGHIRSRYYEADLSKLIDTIKADAAEKLGIKFRKPRIFMAEDGEDQNRKYPPGWRKICDDQAERLGWKPLYSEAEDSNA